jgi:RNA polymerase sigma-70 factor, ECF subfamily
VASQEVKARWREHRVAQNAGREKERRTVAEDGTLLPGGSQTGPLPEADAHLLAQIRAGDVEAGHRFVRDYYPAVYRYLLYLTGHRETAEDLAQETFLLAWRHLDQFQGRAPLRLWLHQIARREFLHTRRRPRASTSLEAVGELPEAHAGKWTDEAELRVILHALPEEQREVMILHYLAGYTSSEIAQIVGARASTVRYRLGAARAHLAEGLGQGDLVYLNEPSVPMRQWAWLPLDQIYALETRLSLGGVGCRATGAEDQAAPGHGGTLEEAMERREFLRHAAVGAAGLMLPEAEKEIIDSRLTQKATLAFKAAALSDLCEYLRSETGVHLAAGPSVADEKLTIFCEKTPLRDVMRQLSRPFGYTWLRSGRSGAYRYELVQDLRSQLLEEELRNRDRHAALLALEREIERFRPYLDLSPDEALARSKTAPPAERPLLETLAGGGWGPIQMYYRLSRQDLEALRAGQGLEFSGEPKPGERALPPDVARGVIQSQRHLRVHTGGIVPIFLGGAAGEALPEDLPLPAVPEVRANVSLWMRQTELGHLTLGGGCYIFYSGPRSGEGGGGNSYATGRNPSVLRVENRVFTGKWAGDPALRPSITVRPQPSCSTIGNSGEDAAPEPRGTTADVLEALHRAAGLPIIADYYTRLYRPEAVSVQSMLLFDALNHLADEMRLRWSKDGSWLQFRSTSYYDDRLKEVPNRLLSRWSESRRQHGALTLDDLCEIALLPDTQLDAAEMAEGARDCFGLAEWDLARNENLRPHLRYLAGFTPEQRQKAMSDGGLPFAAMSLSQQQQFIAHAVQDHPLSGPFQSLEELAGATLRVEYTRPGEYQWGDPARANHWKRWVLLIEPGRQGRSAPRPLIRGRSREAVAEALRRLGPEIRELAVKTDRFHGPEPEPEPPLPLEAQVFPTELSLTFVYFPSASNTRLLHIVRPNGNFWQHGW